MAKKDFLKQKYEEINKLKNMLQNYPEEYRDNIVNKINDISEQISTYLKSGKDRKIERKNWNGKSCFTVEELKKYNGIDENLAYVAINGTVYDVTSQKSWFNGKHYGLKAGQDLTEYFESCHQKEKSILLCLRVVGTLKE